MGKAKSKSKAVKAPSRRSSRAPAAKRSRAKSARKPIGATVLGWLTAPFRWAFRLLWAVAWRVGAVAGLLLAVAVAIIYASLPPSEDLLDGRARGSVTLMDHSGDVFAWRGDQYDVVSSGSVSPYLRNAIIATEDRRFHFHPGIDPIGVIGAIRINLSEGRGALQGHGGSTLTQQTAKLLCVGKPFDLSSGQTEAEYEADCRETSLRRKAHEALYALAMEARYTKDEILTIYMNRAYLGAGARGFEAAAQRYFGKSARQVTQQEAAMLAGLLTAPSRFAPTANLERSRERASVVLGLMERQGYLTADEVTAARANPASLSPAAASVTGGYFADWVMRDEVPDFWGAGTTDDVVLRTTLDTGMQRAAEEALAFIFETKVRPGSKAEAAIVVMERNGAVKAMVGGRQSDVPGGFNRAVQAKRQTGSAFKPFVYATALELGRGANDLVDDSPLTLNIPGSGAWSPQNYSREYRGPVTMTEALQDSLNIPAVRVSEDVGRDAVMHVATEFGIDSSMHDVPALALGVSEASLLELTGAYAGILNGGSAVRPYGLQELRIGREGEPLLQHKPADYEERVISTAAAQELVYMMHQVVEAGTGGRAKLDGHPAAGKTGTTQAARDAWFVGFTGHYVAGVWMGYDDNTPLTGVTGGGLPAEIWRETMARIHAELPPKPLPMIIPAPAAPRVVGVQSQPQGTPNLDQRIESTIRGLFGRVFGN
ncbi:MAG: PBP1A family penicillin-binding protein [Pseudomonadota bacterium]